MQLRFFLVPQPRRRPVLVGILPQDRFLSFFLFFLLLLVLLSPPSPFVLVLNVLPLVESSSSSSSSSSRALIGHLFPSNSLLPPKTILTWVNGIGHNLSHMTTGQEYLSNLFHRPIEFCHNPTFMSSEDDTFGYIGDLTQCTSQKLGKITCEVEELVRHLKQAIQKVGKDGRVIHIAHSQGALITYLACKQLTKEEMRQMEVICFGGAEVIRSSEECPFHRCINYYSVNDPLLFVVPKAAKALRSGFMGMGYGNISKKGRRLEDDTDMRVHDPFAEPEFVFLTPREGDPVKDHGLFGKTYLDALRWEGRRYQTLYLPVWHPIAYTACAFGCEVAHVFHEKLVLYLKVLIRHTILKFVLFVMSVNQWVKDHIVVPLAVFLIMLWEKIKDMAKLLRGEDDDVYQPVPAVVAVHVPPPVQ